MLRREIMLGGQLEGCVADDELARLYVCEEDLGIWRMSAEPDADDQPILIHDIMDGDLTADVEGLTIYYGSDGAGYLIASSQGSSTYVIYDQPTDHNENFTRNFKLVGWGDLAAAANVAVIG